MSDSAGAVAPPLTAGRPIPTAIKVDKGIPRPRGAGRRGGTKYPWEDMQVGDSFAVPLRGRPASAVQAGLTSSKSGAQKKYGHKYVTSVVDEDGVRVVRVWRVA